MPSLRLIPDGLASDTEARDATPADVAKALEVRARAGAVNARNVVSSQSWIELRRQLGRLQDRAMALQLVCSATNYRPLDKQLKMHLAGHPGRVQKFFAGGIGTGKSTSAVVDDLICALLNPGTRGLVVAPTYDQALHVLLPRFLDLCEQMERAGYPVLRKFRWGQMRAELVCGGEVFFRSVSRIDNLLGFEFCWIHFDETETIQNPERVWETLSGRCRQAANFRQMLGTSTPRGMRGVIGIFHRAREEYSTPEERALRRAEWFFVRARSMDNPHLPADYLPSLKRTMSERAWRQEVLAEILRPESAVYDEFSRMRHGLKGCTRKSFVGVQYDLAYDAGDQWPHVLWVARYENGREVIFDELCPDNMTTDRLHDEILARCRALGRMPEAVVCDRAVVREIQWATEAFQTSHVTRMKRRHEQSILDGIEIVRNRLDPMVGEPQLMVADYLFDQPSRRGVCPSFQLYRYPQRADGTLDIMPLKNNVHDHAMDAIRMLMMHRHGEAYRLVKLTARYGRAA